MFLTFRLHWSLSWHLVLQSYRLYRFQVCVSEFEFFVLVNVIIQVISVFFFLTQTLFVIEQSVDQNAFLNVSLFYLMFHSF